MSRTAPIRELPEPTATGLSNNWLAVIFFITAEVMLFLLFIGAFVYLRARGAGWPPPGLPRLDPNFAMFNLAVLLSSAAVAYGAERSIRRYRITLAEKLLLVATALGILFLAGQLREYAVLFQNGITISNSLYGGLFYLTIGFHGAHVLSGVIWLVAVWYSTRQAKQTPFQHFGVQAAVLYWTFVALVWIALFLLLYVA